LVDAWLPAPPRPPNPPSEGATFDVFGAKHTVADAPRSLEEQGQEQLYAKGLDATGTTDGKATYQGELKRLNSELLASFGNVFNGLQDASTGNPVESSSAHNTLGQALERVRLLLINLHDCLNSYRPHEARELLLCRARERLQRSLALAAELRLQTQKSRTIARSAWTMLRKGSTKLARGEDEIGKAVEEDKSYNSGVLLVIRLDGLPDTIGPTHVKDLFGALGCECSVANVTAAALDGLGYAYFTTSDAASVAYKLVREWKERRGPLAKAAAKLLRHPLNSTLQMTAVFCAAALRELVEKEHFLPGREK
jgi:hypothetical protein